MRRITVKKAILNLRLEDWYLCDINRSVALKNLKSVCTYEDILSAHDLWLESIPYELTPTFFIGIFHMKYSVFFIGKKKGKLDLTSLCCAMFCFRKVCDFYR